MFISSTRVLLLLYGVLALATVNAKGGHRATQQEIVEILPDSANQVKIGEVFRHLQSERHEALTKPPSSSPTDSPTISPSDGLTAEFESFLVADERIGPSEQDGPALILGGSDAAFGQFPYFVRITGCGGTLIHPRLVLTAAHCNVDANGVFTRAPVYLGREVRIGALSNIGLPDGSQTAIVINQAIHPLYGDLTSSGPQGPRNVGLGLINDFMILELDRDIIVDSDIELRLSRNPDDIAPGNSLQVIGMGATGDPQNTIENQPLVLQQVTLFALPDSWCDPPFPDVVFCAGYSDGFTGLPRAHCSGDSGGPILRPDENIHYLVGIVSFSPAGCDTANWGAYAQVPGNDEGFGWIHDTVCNELEYNATFCGGNECDTDCDCNEGYECGCLSDSNSGKKGGDDDDDFGKKSGYDGDDDDAGGTERRFLKDFQNNLQDQIPNDMTLDEEQEVAYDTYSQPRSNIREERIESHTSRRKNRNRRVQSSSSGKGKGSKGCKSAKGCKGGEQPLCLDNGELSGDREDEINELISM